MKLNYISYLASVMVMTILTTACNDFIEETPDARITIDNEEKVQALLNSAYPQSSYIRMTELASDNTDDINGSNNGYYDRFSEQCYRWQEQTESDNESASIVWEDYYSAIGAANHALAAIEEMGGASTVTLMAAKGEALLCRAFCHFILVNLFAQHYSSQYADTDLGIPYITQPETSLLPKYDRLTVAEVYRNIEKDLLEGLELQNDAIFDVPRFHFNSKAAYTFASRFYLFYGQMDKVITYTNLVLGSNPKALLRDYKLWEPLATTVPFYRAQQYASSTETANFLLCPVHSTDWMYYGPYTTGGRFNFSSYIASKEIIFVAPWCMSSQRQEQYNQYIFYMSSPNKLHFPKNPAFFEETNASQHTGYYMSLIVPFKVEEALLNRAEAEILLGKDAEALRDLNYWSKNFYKDSIRYNTGKTDWSKFDFDKYNSGDPTFEWPYIYAEEYSNNQLNLSEVHNWYGKYDYYTPEKATPLKELHPDFMQIENGSDQEQLLQVLLQARRLEFLQEGMRWFDIKRYGIEIYRREITTSLGKIARTDSLLVRDPRRAIQIPFEVRSAGLTPNLRTEGLNVSGNEYQIWGNSSSANNQ